MAKHLILGVVAGLWCICAAGAAADDAVRTNIVNRKLPYLDMRFRQVMLDEYVVARRTANVEKVYHQAQKIGRPIIECDGPHELESMALNMPSIVYDAEAGTFRMWWYNIWHGDAARKKFPYYLFGATGYAESTDGLNWTKPALNQVDYKDHGTATISSAASAKTSG